MDEFEQGMACICDAQELLEEGKSDEQIMERLDEALNVLEFCGQEITRNQPR